MKFIELKGYLINFNNVKYVEKYETLHAMSYPNKSDPYPTYEIVIFFANSDNIVLNYNRDELGRDCQFDKLKDLLC